MDTSTKEFEFEGMALNGFLMLGLICMAIFLDVWACIYVNTAELIVGSFIIGVILLALLFIGFMQVEPNESRVLILFGKYKGTFQKNDFFWINPFYKKNRLTKRALNLEIPPIKVNDKVGNPILIGAVMVWRIKDTFRARFDIESTNESAMTRTPSGQIQLIPQNNTMVTWKDFIEIQGNAALREVAGMYAYDNNTAENESVTLRSDNGVISAKLEQELNDRLAIAGIEVVEARINYLAYSSEIASVMLRRQQADAIISAREKIVEGAVTMVEMAIDKLEKGNFVKLDDERKAAMVSNLLVVLCADESAQPVVNTGSLY